MNILPHVKKIHFVGIGGAGMAPMAEVMVTQGFIITGSDREESAVTIHLKSLGILIQYGHEVDLVQGTDLVVYSSAVRANNPELVFALQQGKICIKRAEMLGDLMRNRFAIGISGTHGKTTTTSLIAKLLTECGKDPLVIVGGHAKDFGSHARISSGEVMVVEADEYDRSFHKMFPSIAVVTNIEADHLDIYKDIDDIRSAFALYLSRVPFYGVVVACADDLNAVWAAQNANRRHVFYGFSPIANYRGVDVEQTGLLTSCTVVENGTSLGKLTVPLTGRHNVANALAALAVGREMGISFSDCCVAISKFSGVKRRFEIIGIEHGVTVVDDYAHHPSEIIATLSAARNAGFKRVIAVFQPHLYSRTRDFMDAFVEALTSADEIYVASIYKAREEPIPGVEGSTIVEGIIRLGRSAHFVAEIEKLPDLLASTLKEGDGVILMGAGDIWKQCPRIVDHLRMVSNG